MATASELATVHRRSQNHVTLKFEEVVYKIKIKNNSKSKPRVIAGGEDKKNNARPTYTHERTILRGISGVVSPGEMLAMLGPSGSGKTTLLTALGGRLGGELTGKITYNDKPFSNSMKRNMGFVTQDDVLYPHLTVYETLYYTALLRLPRSLTRQQKAAEAEAVMGQLGLLSCRDSIIGGPLIRGVSGGERKRVSIGQEMLINPNLIFLDEPTSGFVGLTLRLDSTTAQRIVSTLWELATGARTVVMTIHQPSGSLFYMFHKILLLSDGNPIYFGRGSDAIQYFAGIGYSPSVAMNPADFLLDLANGLVSDDAPEDRPAVKKTLTAAYDDNIRPSLREELHQSTKEVGGVEAETAKEGSGWCSSWWEQFRVLLERDLKERRHEAFSGLRIAQVLIIAFLSGLLWFQSQTHVQDQVGLLFFITGFWGFFSLFQSIFTFPQERTMLAKERSSGMYRLSSYFTARVVGDLPMDLILPAIFITIVYFMAGLKPTAAHFFGNLFSLLLSILVSSGLGLALGALVMDLKTATTLASVLMLTFMLVGGFYVQRVPAFVGWIKYLSVTFYAYKLGMISQFSESESYRCSGGGGCLVKDLPQVAVVGLDGSWWAVVVMFGMLVFYRLVAYLALTRIGKVEH